MSEMKNLILKKESPKRKALKTFSTQEMESYQSYVWSPLRNKIL